MSNYISTLKDFLLLLERSFFTQNEWHGMMLNLRAKGLFPEAAEHPHFPLNSLEGVIV